jgi:hypothetical protein
MRVLEADLNMELMVSEAMCPRRLLANWLCRGWGALEVNELGKAVKSFHEATYGQTQTWSPAARMRSFASST